MIYLSLFCNVVCYLAVIKEYTVWSKDRIHSNSINSHFCWFENYRFVYKLNPVSTSFFLLVIIIFSPFLRESSSAFSFTFSISLTLSLHRSLYLQTHRFLPIAGSRMTVSFIISGASVVQWLLRAGLLVNRSSDWSCTGGMIHNRMHLIVPGCPRPSIALQVQNRGLK